MSPEYKTKLIKLADEVLELLQPIVIDGSNKSKEEIQEIGNYRDRNKYYKIYYLCGYIHALKDPIEKCNTQDDLKNNIRFLLENLIVDIGIQVTDAYKSKNGLYEGMSRENVKTRDKYIELFLKLCGEDERQKEDSK